MDLSISEIDRHNESGYRERYSNPEASISNSREALRNSENIHYHKGIAYARLNLGLSAFLRSQTREAFDLVNSAYEYFSSSESEPGYAKSLNALGSLYESIGEYENAMNHCMHALKISRETGDKEIESETTSVLGLIYMRLGNHHKALEFYLQALSIRTELGDEAGMASSINRIAMIYRLMKDFDKALNYYFQSLEIRQKINQSDALPWTHLGIANTYEDTGKDQEALKFYSKGMLDADKRCVLQCRMGRARLLDKSGLSEDAEKEFLGAMKIAEDIDAKSLQAEIHFSLVRHYESLQNPSLALDHFKNYYHIREEVLGEEARNRMHNMEIAHATETAEKEKEIYRLKHVELKAAFDLIEEKNREIISGISYARRIQHAILPDLSEVPGLSESCFILFRPRDIVSGDFYWFAEIEGKLIIAAADCTGHGVPGALMSMLGISFLDEIVINRNILDPAEILNQLRQEIIRALKQTGKEGEQKDGMDISICVINRKSDLLQYAGAYNGIYIASSNSITEYNADHMPIGIFLKSDMPFTKQDIPLKSGDMIYLFSDGIADQFGGPLGKKFKYSTLKNLLLEVHGFPVSDQLNLIESRFLEWKGNLEQVDDVMVIGVRIN
jgi:serine phosphatase RsbU (regulator of sigma subunit)